MIAGVATSKGGNPMAIVEHSTNRLVVAAGGGLSSFSLALDKQAGLARIERNMLMWKRRPLEMPLADIKDFDVATFKDAVSGAELRKLLLRTQADEAIEVPGGGSKRRGNRRGFARFSRAGGLEADGCKEPAYCGVAPGHVLYCVRARALNPAPYFRVA